MSPTQASPSLQVELVNRIGELDELATEPLEGTPNREGIDQSKETRHDL